MLYCPTETGFLTVTLVVLLAPALSFDQCTDVVVVKEELRDISTSGSQGASCCSMHVGLTAVSNSEKTSMSSEDMMDEDEDTFPSVFADLDIQFSLLTSRWRPKIKLKEGEYCTYMGRVQ